MRANLVVMAIASAASMAASAAGIVPIENHDFEKFGTNGVAVGWTPASCWHVEPGAGVSGSAGYVYESKDGMDRDRPTQRVKFRPGCHYRVTAQVMADGLKVNRTDSRSLGATVLVSWFDKNGKWLGERCAQPAAWGRLDDWRTVEVVTPDMPPNAAIFTIAPHVHGNGIGRGRVDNSRIFVCDQDLVGNVCSSAYRAESTGGVVRFAASINLSPSHPAADQHVKFSYVAADGGARCVDGRLVPGGAVADIDTSLFAYGTNDVVCALYAGGKELGRASMRFARLRELPKRRVRIDAKGRTLVDGRPFFPLGMFWLREEEWKQQMADYAKSPFNTIMSYETMPREKLDMAESLGLKVIYQLGCVYGNKAESVPRMKKLLSVRDHPAILAWYSFDEVGVEQMEELEWRQRNFVEALDPDHPTWGCLAEPGVVRYYNNVWDVAGIDSYPVPGAVKSVSRLARELKAMSFGMKAMWFVPQAFAWKWLGRREHRGWRAPTRLEMANMTWQAVAAGANGVLYYSFFDVYNRRYRHKEAGPEDDFKPAFARVCSAAAEVKAFERVLLFGGDPPAVSCGNENVGVRTWREGDETWLLAVNALNEAQAAEVKLDEPFDKVLASDFGKPPEFVKPGSLAFSLPPLGYVMMQIGK